MFQFFSWVLTGILVFYVLHVFDISGTTRVSDKMDDSEKREKRIYRQKQRMHKTLEFFEGFDGFFGLPVNEMRKLKYLEYIERLNIRNKTLNRVLASIEVIGIFKFIHMLGILATVFTVFFLRNTMGLCFLGLFFVDQLFELICVTRINELDREIENDFDDFYQIISGALTKGASARITPTLEDYTRGMEASGRSNTPIVLMVEDLKRNIKVYGDDSIAINKLRLKYKSALIINFCNLAIQSFNGSDNKDKIIAFKIELEQKRLKAMEINAAKSVIKGRRAIFLIYLILAQFIILSWAAKLSTLSLF